MPKVVTRKTARSGPKPKPPLPPTLKMLMPLPRAPCETPLTQRAASGWKMDVAMPMTVTAAKISQ